MQSISLALLALLLSPLPAMAADAPPRDPTWTQGEGLEADLARRVEARVREDLALGMPSFDLDRLPAYAQKPSTLPAPINSKAREALWMYVPALLARGQTDLALATVKLLRDPEANNNPKVIWTGLLYLAEIQRSQARTPQAQEDAVRRVLEDLPAKRFFDRTTALAPLFEAAKTEKDQPLPRFLASGIDNAMTYPVTPDAASTYLYTTHIQQGIWQSIDVWSRVHESVESKKRAEKPRPYPFATVDMEQFADRARPVVLGIMDSGVDPMRYNMYENPTEWPDSLDNDKNGLVDDIFGLVWDWDPVRRHQHGNLDLVEQIDPAIVREYVPYMIGNADLRMGRNDTPEARAFLAKRTSLSTVHEQKEFSRIRGEMGEWAHGTHVAGLAVAGNRWAQVAAFRLAWTGESRIYFERGPSDQELRWESESIDELIRWINAHHVRLINASLGFSVEYQEAALSKERDVFEPEHPAYGIRDAQGHLTDELDLPRIRERAERIQELRRALWQRLFDSCPDTLFVLAAGNDDHDVVEYRDVPVTIPAAHGNLLIVGAVDFEGDWSTFTNFNDDVVKVYDFGVDVPSYTPNGAMVPMSGTSMAAPCAANTVGKILALYPQLQPSQVRDILIETVSPLRKPFRGGIVNEPAALRRAEQVARGL